MSTDIDELRSFQLAARRAAALLRQRWKIIAAAIVVCGGAATAYAFLATPIYKASVVLAPVRQSELGGGLSALLGQFGDIAALAGLGATDAGDDQNAMAILRSRTFAESLIRDNQLLPHMFADRWDSSSSRWAGGDDGDPPTMDEAWQRFDRSVRQITQDQKSGLVTVAIRLPDREAAATLANELASRINDEVRRRATSEAKASRAFLEQQLSQTEDVELKQAIYRLIELQIRRQVLANSKPEFAFALIDPATVPDRNKFDTPKRGLLIVLGLATRCAPGHIHAAGQPVDPADASIAHAARPTIRRRQRVA